MLHLWTENAEVEVQVQEQEPRRKIYLWDISLFMASRGKHDEIKHHVPSQVASTAKLYVKLHRHVLSDLL